MNTPAYGYKSNKTGQRGVAAVEVALVAIPFFLMLLGGIEFGRLMYLWNTVQEVTRNAARQAVVTDFSNPAALSAIRNSAVFRTDAGSLPAASEVSDRMISIKYIQFDRVTEVTSKPSDPGQNISECLAGTTKCIRYVQVSIQDCTGSSCVPVSFQPMLGMFSFLGTLTVPVSTVLMPAESLGFTP